MNNCWRVGCGFCRYAAGLGTADRSVRRHRNALPIPWAVRVPTLTMARELLDALEQEKVRSGEVVVASDGRVYVRWSD